MRSVLLAVLAVAGLVAPARADDDTASSPGRPTDKGTIGVGIVLGEPTGVCAKLYLRDDRAIQGAIGSAFVNEGLQFHADYVFHPWILQDKESFVLPVYVGPGVRVIDYSGSEGGKSHLALGLRAVIGMLFDFKKAPIDAFLEVAGVPEYDFGAGKGFGLALNVGAGVRYYF